VTEVDAPPLASVVGGALICDAGPNGKPEFEGASLPVGGMGSFGGIPCIGPTGCMRGPDGPIGDIPGGP
jgi:hypothetical protein